MRPRHRRSETRGNARGNLRQLLARTVAGVVEQGPALRGEADAGDHVAALIADRNAEGENALDVETCGVRLSIVFGRGRRHGFPAWTSQMLEPVGKDAIEVPVAPDDPMSLISAGDAAHLLALAVRSPGSLPPVLNSGGYRVTARALTNEIAKIEPRVRFPFSSTPEPPFFVDHVSGALAEHTLGFRPHLSLQR
mgnify:CR=1 FL=1